MTDQAKASFTAEDETALRRLATGSVTIGRDLIERLSELKLAERHGYEHRLTPLGRRKFRSLVKPVLHAPDRGDAIEAVLAKYATPFKTAHDVAAPRIETRGRPPRHLAEEARMSPVTFFDAQRSLQEARHRMARLRETMRRQREDDILRASASKACLAMSHSVLATSAGPYLAA